MSLLGVGVHIGERMGTVGGAALVSTALGFPLGLPEAMAWGMAWGGLESLTNTVVGPSLSDAREL